MMSETENSENTKTKQQLDRLIQNVSGLIETRLKIFRLDMEQELSSAVALMITLSMVLILAAIAGLFLSIALAIALGAFFNSYVYGFLAVAGVYILCLIAINQAKHQIKENVRKAIEQQWEQLNQRIANTKQELPKASNQE